MIIPSTATTCASCPGRERNEWCALTRDELCSIDSVKLRHNYRAGDVIFYQGNACAGLHCVQAGTIGLKKADAAGRAVMVRLVHPGETLGGRTFFAGGTYSATAVALTPARVCFIDRATVTTIVGRNPQLARLFLRRLAEDLRAADDEKLEAATLSVRDRLARLLLLLSDKYGVADDSGAFTLELPVARQDMAALLGIRPESVARGVRQLESEGVAHFDGRVVRIPDVAKLQGAPVR